MFSRRRYEGAVRELEDDEAVSADTPRDELLRGACRGSSTHKLSTDAQLEAATLAEARAGKELSEKARRIAMETRETGVAAATELRAQTDQLQRTIGQVERLHDNLDEIQKNVYKLKTPKVKRMFRRGPKIRKELRGVGPSREEATERDNLLARGIGALDLDAGVGNMYAKAVQSDGRGKRFTLFGGRGSRRGAEKDAPVDATQIDEDYSHHTDAVQHVLREQDEDFDVIAGVANDLVELSKAMNTELKVQGPLLDEVIDGATAGKWRLDEQHAKLTGKKRK